MAKKKQGKKAIKKVKIDEDLVRKVDSLVDEIEKTNNFKKITDEDIEELENTLSHQRVNIEKTKNDDIEILGNTQNIDIEKTENKQIKKDLNKTNSYDFKFDDERLTELDSLDTSFLEGRINNNSKKIKKKVKIDNNKTPVIKEPLNMEKFKLPLLILLLVVLAVALVGVGSLMQVNSIRAEKTKEAIEKAKLEKKKKEPKVQSHYLFVGDNFTMDYDINSAYSGYHLAVSGNEDLTSTELLDNLKKYVYDYNPSKVFIQVGINDLLDANEDEELVLEDNIRNIIKGIKEKRPYAEIYIESLYPINDSDDDKIEYKLVKDLYNNRIEKINNNIKDICKNNSVTYIDLYNTLYDEEDKVLKLDYTKDGFNLSEEGYRAITTKIYEYLDV